MGNINDPDGQKMGIINDPGPNSGGEYKWTYGKILRNICGP